MASINSVKNRFYTYLDFFDSYFIGCLKTSLLYLLLGVLRKSMGSNGFSVGCSYIENYTMKSTQKMANYLRFTVHTWQV